MNYYNDKGGLNELALFAGAGGGILGGKLLGWRTVCAVEYEPHAAAILAKRQNDGILQPFPIWDDVRTFDGKQWKGIVDVVSGGFPCQDISCAGKGKGIEGERSGLWLEMARIICEVQPRYVLVENSPMLTIRGLGTVLGDLAEMGFDARWGVLGSYHVGLPSKRERLWLVACRDGINMHRHYERKSVEKYTEKWRTTTHLPCVNIDGRKFRKFPDDLPMDNGMADWMDQIERIGNGQVPILAALAWKILSKMD
jgi:DNA (cytosine-5)-methyltransferase 1